MSTDLQDHWNTVYTTKAADAVSWYQPIPQTSLNFIREFNIPLNGRVIDIGGGDSTLVDHLLELGYQNITVLDLSSKALERAQSRLGKKARRVNWVEADVTHFQASEPFDFWHDRAAFHFLTSDLLIQHYLEVAHDSLHPNGALVLGTFAKDGPQKCSGLPVKQYDETGMAQQLSPLFHNIRCIEEMHSTPMGTQQSFVFCSFKHHQ
jgi:SAM-dependent methyltransferase